VGGNRKETTVLFDPPPIGGLESLHGEAQMQERIREGILYRDHHRRYRLWEPDVPEDQLLTCTRGVPLGNLAQPNVDCWAC
jgi:hypothetical protein